MQSVEMFMFGGQLEQSEPFQEFLQVQLHEPFTPVTEMERLPQSVGSQGPGGMGVGAGVH
jgi:hypothetical protein